MSLFRPTRKVTDPDGNEWEIYVSRYVVPKWQPGDYDSIWDDPAFRGLMFIGFLLEIPRFLWHEILMPSLRFLVVTPYRYLRGRHSTTIWIEAISWHPYKESILWRTTLDHKSRVLDQVMRGLAEGDVARPLGGVFLGSSGR